MKTFADFEIAIDAVDAGRYTVKVRGPGGDTSGELRLPTDDTSFTALLQRLKTLDLDEQALAAIGTALFEALFAGPVRDVYTRSQGALADSQGLRLRLNIAPTAVAAVGALPWELLHDPDKGPLALRGAPVVRYLPQQDTLPSLATPLPLRVLLTGAQTPPPGEVDAELAAVREALAGLGEHVQVVEEPNLTVDRLQQRLREGFHIWHFVGHGGFDTASASGQLLLVDAMADPVPVSATQLGIMVAGTGLRLVVLDACSSGQLALGPLRSFAPELIRSQVPAVVAMQFQVPAQATRAFAGTFYQALAEGFPLDHCMTEGRRAVMNATGLGRGDWGIPVIYTRSADTRLFEPPVAAPAPAAPPAAAGAVQTLGAGLNVLGDLMSAPEVREAVMAFRAEFQAASDQIDVLGDYKDLHDQLHTLQFACYSSIVDAMRRLPDDDLAWENLSGYELQMSEIVDELGRVLERKKLSESELSFVTTLATARTELAAAVEALDLVKLKRTAGQINRVLMTQPSQINMRLTAVARALRLASLAQALGRVRDSLASGHDSEKVRQFGSGVAALGNLSSGLSSLVNDHDRWQTIDVELRMVEQSIDRDLSELELVWPDLREKLLPLYAEVAASWATELKADAEQLEAALAAQDPGKIRPRFNRFRRRAGKRFYDVDVDLKRMCDELRKVGEPLAYVLKMLA